MYIDQYETRLVVNAALNPHVSPFFKIIPMDHFEVLAAVWLNAHVLECEDIYEVLAEAIDSLLEPECDGRRGLRLLDQYMTVFSDFSLRMEDDQRIDTIVNHLRATNSSYVQSIQFFNNHVILTLERL